MLHLVVRTQLTQLGNSGVYGFSNIEVVVTNVPDQLGGGGGGAGAAGGPSGLPGNTYSCSPSPDVTAGIAPGVGKGGIGKAYTIADGTTSVYYAGGGSGMIANNSTATGVHVQGSKVVVVLEVGNNLVLTQPLRVQQIEVVVEEQIDLLLVKLAEKA